MTDVSVFFDHFRISYPFTARVLYRASLFPLISVICDLLTLDLSANTRMPSIYVLDAQNSRISIFRLLWLTVCFYWSLRTTIHVHFRITNKTKYE